MFQIVRQYRGASINWIAQIGDPTKGVRQEIAGDQLEPQTFEESYVPEHHEHDCHSAPIVAHSPKARQCES